MSKDKNEVGCTTVRLYPREKEVLKRLAEIEARTQKAEVNFLIMQRAKQLKLGEEIPIAARK